MVQIYLSKDFPGSPAIKILPCNAGDVGSTPGLGTKLPHVEEQLSPCATLLLSASASTAELKHSGARGPQRNILCAVTKT